MDVAFTLGIALMVAVVGIFERITTTRAADRLRIRRDDRSHLADLAQARIDADQKIDAARVLALAMRQASLEELKLRNDAVVAEEALLEDRERLLRDRNHHWNQHRHSYKERRAVLDEQLAAAEAARAQAWQVVIERANLDRDAAEQAVLGRVDSELAAEHSGRVERTVATRTDDPPQEARNLITYALERQEQGHADGAPRASPLPLEGFDEGGRERLLAALAEIAGETSMELSVDPERDHAALRGQDPIGREVARQAALEVASRRLEVADVSPLVLRTRSSLAKAVRDLGERSMWEMEIGGRPELTELIGTLHYRFSYGQNALLHCKEAGYLCGVLASELGLPQALAREAGMLHDIGKSVDHDVEGSHAIIGGEILRVFGSAEGIIHAVKAHHFDEEPSSDLAMLTICADAISASRPGARRDTLAAYLARLEHLQEIATRHQGVERAFPLQAGREVRVVVKAKEVPDGDVAELGRNIAREIEAEMQYPGVIKVTVIRETMATATAPAQLGSGGTSATAIAELPASSKRRRKRKRRPSGGLAGDVLATAGDASTDDSGDGDSDESAEAIDNAGAVAAGETPGEQPSNDE